MSQRLSDGREIRFVSQMRSFGQTVHTVTWRWSDQICVSKHHQPICMLCCSYNMGVDNCIENIILDLTLLLCFTLWATQKTLWNPDWDAFWEIWLESHFLSLQSAFHLLFSLLPRLSKINLDTIRYLPQKWLWPGSLNMTKMCPEKRVYCSCWLTVTVLWLARTL